MQVFLDKNLVFLAVPKTGSTAYEAALRPHASFDIKSPPRIRHMTARRYRRTWRRFLKRAWGLTPETMAVLRHPRARLESWFRYRLHNAEDKTTSRMDFDEFVRLVLSDDPPPAARIGKQDVFATAPDGEIIIDHLFVIERPEPLLGFLEGRFGAPICVDVLNASPAADTTLSPETEALLRDRRAPEFDLYDRVAKSGHLHTPQV